MDTKAMEVATTDRDRVVGIEPDPKVSRYIPDYIQKTIMEQLDKLEHEIHQHEESIRELEALYMAHVHFLEHYSPFETGNLSQDVSIDKALSPGVSAPGREGGQVHEESLGSTT